MTEDEFQAVSQMLRGCVRQIPLHWGRVQNDCTDKKMGIFSIPSYEGLEERLKSLPKEDRDYFKRRWFISKCSACDEYLFYRNEGVSKNPNSRDKEYDVLFQEAQPIPIGFDVKDTEVPSKMLSKTEELLVNPEEMIAFFYERQSKDVRYGLQNRLFVVHHSFISRERSLFLRVAWQSKRSIFEEYVRRVRQGKHFFSYGDSKADVIFVLERARNNVDYVLF